MTEKPSERDIHAMLAMGQCGVEFLIADELWRMARRGVNYERFVQLVGRLLRCVSLDAPKESA